jgi:muramidase (phage lysozyme)
MDLLKVKRFLDLVAWAEGADYNTIVSGIDGKHTFTDFSAHPFANGRPPIVVNHHGLDSTASGRYQIRIVTWREVAAHLGLKDFSPASQDAAAIELLRRRHALDAIESGDIATAVRLCRQEWASLPGNEYGQGGKTLAALLDKYAGLEAVNA